MIKISRGLNIPITGNPEQIIEDALDVKRVALVGDDYVGMKPTMAVAEGDVVKKGQLLFTDKKTEGVQYTAPVSGKVVEINRGAKRVFESLVIERSGDEEEQFDAFDLKGLSDLDSAQIRDQLVSSGLWVAFRTRPFSKVPATNTTPADIFINAMDSNPLSVTPKIVIEEQRKFFEAGLVAVSKLTQGSTYLCKSADTVLSTPPSEAKITTKQFSGKHPSGLTGTHIHFVSPVGLDKTVWSIGYQDVIAIGILFLEGRIDSTRVISLAGPSIRKPRLLRTFVGASTRELTSHELTEDENRVISGSVLGGRQARGSKQYLGRYHLQISALQEGFKRDFMGWFSPGLNRFSTLNIYLSKFLPKKRFSLTTSTNGSPRAMVPLGLYERVFPLDLLPTQLLRSLIVGDIETAIKLGALELDEEDLALCSFVCPGKYEYGPILRDMLTRIEKEVL
ncbi:MAG: Na(+)-translocating NADH-quinone reductase subunit A [Pseudomonadota bacterium]